jgi:phosphatidylglycerophosphatase A
MWRKWAATFGGTGLLPVMPGTFASLAAAVIFLGLWYVLGEWARLAALLLTLPVTAAAWLTYPWAAEYFHDSDPRQCVLDEAVGQWLTLIMAPLAAHPVSSIAMGFFLFRAFDVAKPFPIDRLDRLHGFVGFYLDDAAAGLFAGVVLWAFVLISGWLFGPAAVLGFI